MGTRSNSCKMRSRWWFLIAGLLTACGSGRGLSSRARLDGQHFKLGPEVDRSCRIPGLDSSDHLVLQEEKELKEVRLQEPDLGLADMSSTMDDLSIPAAGMMESANRPAATSRGSVARGAVRPWTRPGDPWALGEGDLERTKWNRFALAAPLLFIAALAVAVPLESTELLLLGCALAFASALVGARQCRDRGERGQGFAMAVLGLSLAGVLIATIALLARL